MKIKFSMWFVLTIVMYKELSNIDNLLVYILWMINLFVIFLLNIIFLPLFILYSVRFNE